MTLHDYIDKLNRKFRLGNSTEHTFRGNLETLIEDLIPHVSATNEPAGQKCGKPDYVLMKNDIPLGYIEAKDVGDKDLEGKKFNKSQFDRYKSALNNLIFTDYLSFHFYRDGEKNGENISIGKIEDGSIVALPENFATFTDRLKDFCASKGTQTIRSSKKLSAMMAGKARLLSNIIELALNSDATHNEDGTPPDSTLKDQMEAFKEILIHDITAEGFADIYAQTITYGMFAARLHDPTLPTFSRQEAAELIPKSNPFLRKLFGYIAGPDLDSRIKWIVDDLVEIFLACDVKQILKDYGKSSGMEDPIIHFYENFLSEYDPALRKARGVWYTPQPVVSFIVRAVDEILKTEFHLPQGLADTSKTTIQKAVFTKATADSRSKTKMVMVDEEVHKVEILDPATGTGTFLAETIKHIHKKFSGQKGLWSNYVENHLLSRLNGFELLMASYAMAHLQLDLLLTETGYKPTLPSTGGAGGGSQRIRVYLTNSLEEHHPDTSTLFANWLSSEANEANHIKRDNPVMVVMGNPPYSGESANKGEWIMKLMEDYKKEPGGTEKLNERNPKWINDDYVKFLRYGQHFIEKSGEGIVAFINPHGFLDNPTFRGMRWNLLKTYDKIYTIDLHGNSKKKEVSPDGTPDVNVFDIMQGVSINIFVKTGKKKANELGKVFHFDLFGKREFKYDFLTGNSLKTISYKELPNLSPNYFFVNKDFDEKENYEKGFSINEIFTSNSIGIVTAKDSILINNSKILLINSVENYYKIKANTGLIKQCFYRPFDTKFIYYDTKLIERGREKVMKNFLIGENLGLLVTKAFQDNSYRHVSITNRISEAIFLSGTTGSNAMNFPIYLYSDRNDLFAKTERTPNLNQAIIDKMAEGLALKFTHEKEKTTGTFAPIDVLDYIYAVLHSPTYREKYKEFLKIDFPRVPYPKSYKVFKNLIGLGSQLRQIHLLESPVVEEYITEYPEDGNNVVGKIRFENVGEVQNLADVKGRVYINENQYFDKVPETAWNFYIGGYQPAQKWLKDRKERELSFEDILHYQKIIVALTETARIMQEIDLVGVE